MRSKSILSSRIPLQGGVRCSLPEPPEGPAHQVTLDYLDSLEEASDYFREWWPRQEDCSDLGRLAAHDVKRLVGALRIYLANDEAWHPLPGAPLQFRLRLVAILRFRLGAGSGLLSAGLFCILFQ